MTTHGTGPVQHADAEIPQQKTAIISDTAKSVGFLITAPGIKGNCRDPGIVTLASGNYSAFREGPNGDQVVLASSHDVLTIGGPTNADQATVITAENVQDPTLVLAK